MNTLEALTIARAENPEPTRKRKGGTMNTRAADFADPGMARIEAIRNVLTNGYAKIDGIMMDSFSASAITQVYDALNDANKAKYRNLSPSRMAAIAYKYVKGAI